MIIIYYKDHTGKIVLHHGSVGPKTFEELVEGAALYNRDSKRTGKTAHVVEVEDDSLTAYLFSKANERKKYNEDEIQCAIDSIEDALEAVRGLIVS